MPFNTAATGAYLNRGLMLLLSFNLVVLSYYLCIDYQYQFHSDSAVRNLLAQEIVETGNYFPADWFYVNKDLWVYFTHSLVLPLLAFAPNGYGVYAVSGMLYAALLLGAAWCLGTVLEQSLRARLLCALILSGGISIGLAENMFGQAAYGTLFTLAALLVFVTWRYVNSQGRARLGWAGAAAVLLLLVFWGNPQRALITFALPLAGALFALWLSERQSGAAAPAAAFALPQFGLLLVLAAVAGILLHFAVLGRVQYTDGLGQVRWLTFGAMARNMTGMLEGLISMLGGMPEAGAKVASVRGVYQALRLVVAVALIGMLPWALAKLLARRHRGQLFFATFTLVSVASSCFIFLTTTLADYNDFSSSIRYLTLSVLCLLLVLVSVIVDVRAGAPALRLGGKAMLLVLACGAPFALLTHSVAVRGAGGAAVSDTTRLANFMQANGLQYGYASFWHAGRLSVMSAQQVRVRQILWDKGLPTPMRHLSSNRWYTPQAWNGPTFVLIKNDEASQVDWRAMQLALGEPQRKLAFDDYQIVVYADNIAAHLPSWRAPQMQQTIALGQASLHNVGRLQASPPALVAEAQEAGVLHFGPYAHLERGRYEITFSLQVAAKSAGPAGAVEVSSNGGAKVHATAALGEGKQRIVLPFALSQATAGVEYRVLTSGLGRVELNGIEIRRVN